MRLMTQIKMLTSLLLRIQTAQKQIRTAQILQTAHLNNDSRRNGIKYGRVFKRNKLESSLDLLKNRAGCHSDRFFSGSILRQKDHEAPSGCESSTDGILTLPLVLPPTVAGFFLLLIFSLKRPLGSFLLENFDIKIVQTWKGCVVAAAVIAFPLMYRNARAAFEQVDINLIYAGQTLGMSDNKIFWRVVMPAAGPGIASGTVLAFARAIGEYGATSMLAGNILGKTRTVSVAIATETAAGNYGTAGFWVVVIVLISFVIVALINIVSGRGMKTRRWI